MKNQKKSKSDKVLIKLKGANLRQKFTTSHFFEEKYDEAIIGVLTYQDRIVYDFKILIEILLDEYQERLASKYGGYDSDEYYFEITKIMMGRFLMCEKDAAEGVLKKYPPLLMTTSDGFTKWIPEEKVKTILGGNPENYSPTK